MPIQRNFILEALKITLFCLLSTGIFVYLGANEKTLLVLFNIAVMSAAATFSPEKKRLIHLGEGCVVIIASIMVSGVLGFYFPGFAKIIAIVYATLAFLVPKTKFQSNIFVTGALMFLIFASLPFSATQALIYSAYALLLLVLYLLIHWVLDRHIYCDPRKQKTVLNEHRVKLGITCLISMTLAVGLSAYLHHISALTHLYWIGLTVLVILQSSSQGTVKIALLRMLVNATGAIAIVVLMSTVMPTLFWANFGFLSVLLFAIFAFGYSYIARTLFIELFVLSFTHLLGDYHNVVSVDRIILTLIGGSLVIVISVLANQCFKSLDNRQS